MTEGSKDHTPYRDMRIVGGAVRRLDEYLKDHTLPEAVRLLCRLTRNVPEVFGMTEETERILREESVLLVGNHDFVTEQFPIIASLPPRDTISMMGERSFLGIGPNFANYLLPIYFDPQTIARSQKETIRRTQARERRGIRFAPSMSWREGHLINKRSMAEAVKRLDEGELVIILPQGVLGTTEWLAGVGRVIKGLKPDSLTYYVKVYVKGATKKDWCRIIPGANLVFPRYKVTYSEPQVIDQVLEQRRLQRPMTITSQLRKDYLAWVESIQKKR